MQQRQIWIVAAFAFVVLCAAGVSATIHRDYRTTIDQIRSETVGHVRLMAAQAGQGLDAAALVLDRAAGLVETGRPTSEPEFQTLRTRFSDLVAGAPAVGTLWAVDRNGMAWLNNNSASLFENDVSGAAYFRASRADPGRLAIGPTEMGVVVHRPRFTLARALLDPAGAFAGVVVAGIDQEYLQEIARGVRGNADVVLQAFDPDGAVLAAEPDDRPERLERVKPVLAEMGDGGFALSEVDGWLIAAERLGRVPVTLVAATEVKAALADWRQRSLRLGLLGLLMAAGFLSLTQQGLRALRNEEAAARELAEANRTLEARVHERTQTVELLFRELNHRVKNNLQIIASLLRLQLRKARDAETRAILQDSINRIFAIADVHGELENAEGGVIGLRSYVGKIVGRIRDAMQKPGQSIAVTVDVADVELPVDRAVLIAIALNETVTNAFKHGFAEGAEGRLDVRIRRLGPDLAIDVHNDLPADDRTLRAEPEKGGLGSSIVGLLVQQMSGTVEVDRSDGYIVRLRVPLHAESAAAIEHA